MSPLEMQMQMPLSMPHAAQGTEIIMIMGASNYHVSADHYLLLSAAAQNTSPHLTSPRPHYCILLARFAKWFDCSAVDSRCPSLRLPSHGKA